MSVNVERLDRLRAAFRGLKELVPSSVCPKAARDQGLLDFLALPGCRLLNQGPTAFEGGAQSTIHAVHDPQ